MDRNSSGESSIGAISERQHGAFSRAQALGVGFTRHQIEHRCAIGRWDTLLPRVHRITGTPDSLRQRWMASVLWAGDGALVSHRAAAVRWDFDGVRTGRPEITSERRLRSSQVTVHHVLDVSEADRAVHCRIPVTTPTRTLIDIAGDVDNETLETALEGVLRRRLSSLPRLEWRVSAVGIQKGIGQLRELLEQRQNRPLESKFEVRFERLLRKHGLPLPERQRVVKDEWGRHRVDFAYHHQRIVIECVSWRYHSGQKAWREDIARRRRLAAQGWRVIEFTWQEVSWEPTMVIATLVDALNLATTA